MSSDEFELSNFGYLNCGLKELGLRQELLERVGLVLLLLDDLLGRLLAYVNWLLLLSENLLDRLLLELIGILLQLDRTLLGKLVHVLGCIEVLRDYWIINVREASRRVSSEDKLVDELLRDKHSIAKVNQAKNFRPNIKVGYVTRDRLIPEGLIEQLQRRISELEGQLAQRPGDPRPSTA